MANVLVNGRAASPLASSSSSSYGLADLKLPEPKDPHPQEWRLPHEHKMEKREVYYVSLGFYSVKITYAIHKYIKYLNIIFCFKLTTAIGMKRFSVWVDKESYNIKF